MPTLKEYLGGLFDSLSQARVAADLHTLSIAEQYAQHELLRHFAVPRMRFSDVVLDVPVAIEGLNTRLEYQLRPIGNDAFRTTVYAELVAIAKLRELPLLASQALQSALIEPTRKLAEAVRFEQRDEGIRNFAIDVNDRFLQIGENYGLFGGESGIEYPYKEALPRLIERCHTLIGGAEEKPVLDGLSVVTESHRLREQRPEDMLRIRLSVGEEGMEWQTIERSDGGIERRLLPE